MKRLFIYIAFAATGLCMPSLNAQTTEKKTEEKEPDRFEQARKNELEKIKQRKLESLEQEKNNIAENEKFELKKVLDEINSKLEAGSITPEKAQEMKEEAAKNAALNIDSKIALIEAQAELVRRDVKYNFTPYAGAYLEVGFGNAYDDAGSFLFGVNYKTENKKLKYDKRTYTDVVFAFGWNNTVGDGQTIGDSYSFGKSASAEIGFTFRTRLLKESNKVRLAYGISFQQNVLSPKNNKYFVNDNGTTVLEEFPHNLKRNELAISNLIAPFFFEFGPSRKREYKDYFRYDTSDQFKVGIGGYAGVNLGTTQRLKYKEDGERIVDRLRKDYNVTPFVYGVSGYVGVGPLSLFVKYELNTVFEHSAHKDHNLTFGFRTDL
jgi:hypothetical protein